MKRSIATHPMAYGSVLATLGYFARHRSKETTMKQDTQTTKVIFRWWQNSVIALFPRDPGSVGKPWECSSYQHMGQHGSAYAKGIVVDSRLATPDEYADLARELRQLGYKLVIVKRLTSADYEAREKACR